jgi:hypothetical protein
LTDLHKARIYLEVQETAEVSEHLHYSRKELDEAIAEITKAAVLDQKDVNDHPDVDTSLDRPGRIHKAVDLLRGARNDISIEEDDAKAVVWRQTAIQHIDESIKSAKAAAKALGVTGL